jgi:hypothetical protein
MLSEIQQRQLIAEIMKNAIDSGKIKFDPAPIQQIVQESKPETPTYEGGRISIFDLLTCIMFTLNLMGETDISWWLVFLPFAFPYIEFYGVLWSAMLWVKFKNRKNKEDGETKTN